MKTKPKSKLLSILLVLVMVLALVPFSSITALAVTNGTGTQQSPLTVTTYEELKAALADNTTQYIVVNEFETNCDNGNGGFYQINQAVGETFEPTKDTVISAVWVDIPANELGGKGTKESPLYVNTYAELKAALADDVTEYIIVKDFLYTNDGGYHLINNPIDGEDYALWSNPDIHKHLTIDTKVRLGVYLACPNITKGIEVAGKLTIDGSGSFNTSFLSNKRGTVINVTSTGTRREKDRRNKGYD